MGPLRYIKNHDAISFDEQLVLERKRVAIIGCGGLGAYVLEHLGRLGVGFLKVVDPDTFEESNLNRQLLSSSLNLGRPKVLAAKQRLQAINPLIEVEGIQTTFNADNAGELLSSCDVVVDALDNIPDRRLLQESASEMGIPLVHGALAGWSGRVCVIHPGEYLLNILYADENTLHGAETQQGTLSFTASLIASLQAAELVKLLLGKPALKGEILEVDLLNAKFQRIRMH